MILILKQLLSLLETVIWETLLGIATSYLSIYRSMDTWVGVCICRHVSIYVQSFKLCPFRCSDEHSNIHDIQIVNNSFSFLKITLNWEIFHPDPHWSQCVKMAPSGQWKRKGNGRPMSFVSCGRKPSFSRYCSSEWRKKTRSYKVCEALEYYTIWQYKFTFLFSLWPWYWTAPSLNETF